MPAVLPPGLAGLTRETFNSLFEMQVSDADNSVCVVMLLSILYLRCQDLSSAWRSQRRGRLSILYLRCQFGRGRWRCLSTHLCLSILYLRCDGVQVGACLSYHMLSILYLRCSVSTIRSTCAGEVSTFNSLFEMQRGALHRLLSRSR